MAGEDLSAISLRISALSPFSGRNNAARISKLAKCLRNKPRMNESFIRMEGYSFFPSLMSNTRHTPPYSLRV